jgi:hypothetical protein
MNPKIRRLELGCLLGNSNYRVHATNPSFSNVSDILPEREQLLNSTNIATNITTREQNVESKASTL